MTTSGEAFGRQRAGRSARDGQSAGDIVACRDDGLLARQIGRVVQGQLPPLLPAVAGVTVTAVLAALAFALQVPAPATFALIAVIALHHMDLLHRHRYGMSPGPKVAAAGLGWEGRMLVAGIGGMLGIETVFYIALAGYLGLLFGRDSLTCWLAVRDGENPR